MKRNARTALNQLIKIGAPVFDRSDVDYFVISAENNVDKIWADYYGESRGGLGGLPFVCPEIESVLVANGLFAEWENAGCLIAYDA